MSDTLWNASAGLLLIGLPVAGMIASLLLAARPDSSFTAWWALGYSLCAISAIGLLTARYWNSDDDLWNGLHVLAIALALEAFALTWVALRMPPGARGYGLVRALAALACVISACAVFFTVGAGSGQ